MLSRLRNMFRVADLRNKILFTVLVVAIYRLGSHIPLPYVDFRAIQELKDRASEGGALEFLDLFSGGALTNVAVFALGIMPYITSLDHHAAAGGGDPQAGGMAAAGPGRAEEDHAVDPLPDGGAGAHAVDRHRLRPPPGRRQLPRSGRPGRHRPDPRLQCRPGHAHRHHAHGGYGHDHVARRADHPAGHRQRHVDPDLRLGRLPPPRPGWPDLRGGEPTSSSRRSSPWASP